MASFTINPARLAVVSAVTVGLCASMLVAVPAQAAAPEPNPLAATGPINSGLDLQAADVEMGLRFIEEIPEVVLASGDEALHAWIEETHPELLKGARADILGCAGAIAFIIASTAIPAAKILKIKKLIDGLGGVAKAVQLFWGASFKWEKIRALGGAAAALGAELLGIAAVQKKCFS